MPQDMSYAYRLVSTSGSVIHFVDRASPRIELDGTVIWDGVAMETEAETHGRRDPARGPLYDPITGLGTRTALEALVSGALSHRTVEAGHPTLFALEIENLAAFRSGPERSRVHGLLQAIARRLTDFAEPCGTAARLDNGRFAVFAVLEARDELEIVDMLSEEMSRPFRVDGRSLSAHCVVRVTTFDDVDDPGNGDPGVAFVASAMEDLRAATGGRGGGGWVSPLRRI
jgi:GGDEF domain-containing protein